MRPLPTAKAVWKHLERGATIADAERVTGWPAHAVRRLVENRPGWLVDSTGRAMQIRPSRAGGNPPRRPQILAAEIDKRCEKYDLTWQQVAEQIGVSLDRLIGLRGGRSSMRLRQRVENWLAAPPQTLADVRARLALYDALRDRKIRRRLTWREVYRATGAGDNGVRSLRRGRPVSPETTARIQRWLEETAPAAGEVAVRDTG